MIVGGPRCGKTSLGKRLADERGIPVHHTDDLIGTYAWSEASSVIAGWLDQPAPWIVEGVAALRALRKWMAAHRDGAPADRVFMSETPRVPLTPGQAVMLKGCVSIWTEIRGALEARGVEVEFF